MSENFQHDALSELRLLFGPMIEAGREEYQRHAVLEAVGWLLDQLQKTPGGIAGQLETALQAFAAIGDLFDTFLDTPPDSLEALQEVLKTVLQLFEAVRALSKLQGSAVLAELGTLGEDLIQFLALDFLQRWAPRTAYVLALLTLITLPEETALTQEVKDATGAVVRKAYQPGTLNLDHLTRLLKEPLQMLREEYFPAGLASEAAAQAAADKLFPRLSGFLYWWGSWTSYDTATHTLYVILPAITDAEPLAATLALSATEGGLVVTPSGAIDITQQVGTLDVTLKLDATGRFVVGAQGLKTPGVSILGHISLSRHPDPGAPAIRVGSTTGTRLEVKGLRVTGDFNPDPAHINYGLSAEVQSASIIIAAGDGDGFLQKILPADGIQATFDLGLGWSNKSGFYLRGNAALEMTFGVHVALGPILIDSVHVGISPRSDRVQLELSTIAGVDIGPVAASIDRLGLAANIFFRSGNLGPLDLAFGFKPPNGLGLLIDAGAVVGGGYIFFDVDKGQYAGVLELKLETIQIKAIGILDTRLPDGSTGFSFLIIITAEFSPIQLGFGFTLIGVGGLAGINRTMVLEALRSGLRNHTLNSILFPPDPIRNAPQIISDLRTIFPPVEGRYVFGPMIEIGWGTPTIISASLGVLLELPSPVRLALLGQIKAVLPTDDAALILLHIDILGIIDFGAKYLSLDGTIYDSRIVVFSLLGDMALRLNWGDNPNFLCSIGGFHPRFQPPAGFPTLHRLMVSIGYGDYIRMSLSSYQAFTSNTVQFGASFDLRVDFAGFRIHGYFSFDALFIFTPFSFIAEMRAGVELSFEGLTLFSIHLDLMLSGPTPWHAHGTASIDILFFSISVSVDITFGDARQVGVPKISPVQPLLDALNDVRNWSAALPEGAEQAVSLTAAKADEKVILMHPMGLLTVRQTVVPLGITITKFGEAAPAEADKLDITGVTFGQGTQNEIAGDEPDYFASAHFFTLSDAQKLAAPSYTQLKAGVKVGTADIKGTDDSNVSNLQLSYDTFIVDDLNVPGTKHDVYSPTLHTMQFLNRQGAAELSLVRATGNAKYVVPGTVSAVKLVEPKYVVTSTEDLTVSADVSSAGGVSYFAAVGALQAHLAAHPEKAGLLQVVPLHEV